MIKQEHKETGAVLMSVYLRYFKACSITLCIISIILQFVYHTILVCSNFWLARWSSESDSFYQSHPKVSEPSGAQSYAAAGNGNGSVVVVSNITAPPSLQVWCLFCCVPDVIQVLINPSVDEGSY